jgi:hypothetical protein
MARANLNKMGKLMTNNKKNYVLGPELKDSGLLR